MSRVDSGFDLEVRSACLSSPHFDRLLIVGISRSVLYFWYQKCSSLSHLYSFYFRYTFFILRFPIVFPGLFIFLYVWFLWFDPMRKVKSIPPLLSTFLPMPILLTVCYVFLIIIFLLYFILLALCLRNNIGVFKISFIPEWIYVWYLRRSGYRRRRLGSYRFFG